MMNRRNFLQLSTAAVLPILQRPLWAQAHAHTHVLIGLQLSTLVKRPMPEPDLVNAFQEIHAIGFQEVEPWHTVYSIPAKRLRQDIAASGLTVACGHFEYSDLAADLTGQLQYAKALGLKWVICPMLPKAQWMSPDGYHTAARQFNAWAARAHDMGMGFAFHNHDYEFRNFGGTTGYEILLKETDPKLVFYEMDCYWITQAGLDPVQVLHQLGRRVRMLHIKDRKPGFPPSNDMSQSSAHFTEVGSGSINWPAILRVAKKLQIEHYFIEQDHIDGPPLESLRASYTYLRKILS